MGENEKVMVMWPIQCPVEFKTFDGSMVLYEDDGVNYVHVYKGCIGWLEPVTLEWHVDKDVAEMCETSGNYLTLDEIAEQVGESLCITVFIEGMFSGEILLYNNYGTHEWVRHGRTKGYA